MVLKLGLFTLRGYIIRQYAVEHRSRLRSYSSPIWEQKPLHSSGTLKAELKQNFSNLLFPYLPKFDEYHKDEDCEKMGCLARTLGANFLYTRISISHANVFLMLQKKYLKL